MKGFEVRKLRPDMEEEFFYYFEHVAFADHPEWAGCYCLEGHQDGPPEEALDLSLKEKRRELAGKLIREGVMNGYLIYDNGKCIAWCNSDDKKNYLRIRKDENFWLPGDENLRIKSVYCFEISQPYRGKGIAKEILKHICEEARAEGYDHIEGYPLKTTDEGLQYHGPIRLYEKMGFKVVKENEFFYVCRL